MSSDLYKDPIADLVSSRSSYFSSSSSQILLLISSSSSTSASSYFSFACDRARVSSWLLRSTSNLMSDIRGEKDVEILREAELLAYLYRGSFRHLHQLPHGDPYQRSAARLRTHPICDSVEAFEASATLGAVQRQDYCSTLPPWAIASPSWLTTMQLVECLE